MSASVRKIRGFLRRYARAKRGAAAVEFAMIATPFFLLLMGLIEIGMVLLVSTTLESSLDAASRRIRTGEVQTGGVNVAALRTQMCSGALSFLGSGCASRLALDVRGFTSFSAVAPTNPVKPAAGATPASFDSSKMCWDPGGPGSVELVTAYYRWKLYTPLLSDALVTLGSSERLMSTSAVFKNEPYSNTPVAPTACPTSY